MALKQREAGKNSGIYRVWKKPPIKSISMTEKTVDGKDIKMKFWVYNDSAN